MIKFLTNKVNSYFDTSKIPNKCIKYLKKNHSLYDIKIDHIEFRTISIDNFKKLNDLITSYNPYNCPNFYKRMDDFVIDKKSKSDIEKISTWYKHPQLPKIFLSYRHLNEYQQFFINLYNSKHFNKNDTYEHLKHLEDDYVPSTFLWEDEINHIGLDMSQYETIEEFKYVVETMIEDLQLDMNSSENLYQNQITPYELIQCSTKPETFNNLEKNYIKFVYKKENQNLKKKILCDI